MNIKRPNTIIYYSIVPAFIGKGKRWRLLCFWLIFPIVLIIKDVILLRSRYIEVYDAYVIKKKGIFRKYEEKHMFPKIESCTVNCSFIQRIFKYGSIDIKTLGDRWNIEDLQNIKNPFLIRKHIEKHFVSAKEIKAMRHTVITH